MALRTAHKLLIRYQGTRFLGWQKTDKGLSVEGLLTEALSFLLKRRVSLDAASRTDAGVHAQAQVVAFSSSEPLGFSEEALKRALNGTLPPDIRVLAIEETTPDFHPTLSAIKKEYVYALCNGPYQLPFHQNFSWHIPKPLDVDAMGSAIPYLLGTHDFSAFCNERALWTRSPICTLENICVDKREQNRLFLTFIGDHFLYKMVRNLTGALVSVGQGDNSPEDLQRILESQDRRLAPMTAPAFGLYLKKVHYL